MFPFASNVHPRYLDDVSLHHLINALCSLSMEAMEMAYGNNKVNIFQYYQANLKYRNVFFFFLQNDRKWILVVECLMFSSPHQEPSLFAVAKLLETGLVNMDRIEILWRPLTGHLLEVKSVTRSINLR